MKQNGIYVSPTWLQDWIFVGTSDTLEPEVDMLALLHQKGWRHCICSQQVIVYTYTCTVYDGSML